jgi:UDP-glucose 4-epimerase
MLASLRCWDVGIGSHATALLTDHGYETIVFDNLVYGHPEFVQWGELVEGDLNDIEALRNVFSEHDFHAVLHFAAYTDVDESTTDPEKYYRNNVCNTLNLLSVMREFDVKHIVFSSTCATYGDPQYIPLDEAHSQNPINPYGCTKLMVEMILKDFSSAYGIGYVVIRYFNAAGCDPKCRIGEWHDPETHLIPLILDAALDPEKSIRLFGTDYDTDDGTCIRDYIHVTDLADAHIKALSYLEDGGTSVALNLGNGQGYSVREVIDTVQEVTGKEINVIEEDRREGDPPVLVGCADKAKSLLGWNPQYTTLRSIIETAWAWHQKLQTMI